MNHEHPLLELSTLKGRLRQLRQNNPAMTLKDMSEVVGVSERTMRRYDDPSDPSEPGFLAVAKICQHYGISMDYLAFGSTTHMDDQEKLFRMMMQHFDLELTPEAKAGFASFIQGVWDNVIDLTLKVGDAR